MSKLQLHGRPWVSFNAHNPNHRQWYAEFVSTGTWGHCPVRFVVDDSCGDLLTQIQRELINYYVGMEFSPPTFKLLAA
jgi:hypothetical protein